MTNTKVDFFLVGAARSGTTSLYNYLNENKDIFLPNVKEPNFFSNVSSHNKEDYELPKKNKLYHNKIIDSPRVYQSLYDSSDYRQLRGDTSPSYLWDIETAERIYKYNPEAKIIITLRHPVDRAYSHYIMNYFIGVETNKTFELALKAKENLVWGSCNQYLKMGMYYNQVKKYYDIYPKSQIKVLVYEDWIKDIVNYVNHLFEFIGTNPLEISNFNVEQHNKIKPIKHLKFLNFLRQNNIKKSIKKILSQEKVDMYKSILFEKNENVNKLDKELRHTLSRDFKEDVFSLSSLTGIDFSEKWNI